MPLVLWTLLACRSAPPTLPDVGWDVVPPEVAGTVAVSLSDYAEPAEPADPSLTEACAAGTDVRASYAIDWAIVTVSDREIRLGEAVVAQLDGGRPRRARGFLIWGLYEALRNQELRGTTYGGACWGQSHDRALLVVDEEAPAALVEQVVFTSLEAGRRDVSLAVGGEVVAVPDAPVVTDGRPPCGDHVEVELLDGHVDAWMVEPWGGGRVSAHRRWDEATSAVEARDALASVAGPGAHLLDLRIVLRASMTFGQLLRFVRPWTETHAPLRWTWHVEYAPDRVVPWSRAEPELTRRRAEEWVSVLPFQWPAWGPCEDVDGKERRPGGSWWLVMGSTRCRGPTSAATPAGSPPAPSTRWSPRRPCGSGTEQREVGVHVTTVNPGFVRTPLTDKNDFAMPMMWEVDVASRHIVDGIERKRRVIEFPAPLSLLTRLAKNLPAGMLEAVLRRMIPNP